MTRNKKDLKALKIIEGASSKRVPPTAICAKGHVTSTPLDEGCHHPSGEYQDEVFDTVEIDGKKIPIGQRVYLCCGETVRPHNAAEPPSKDSAVLEEL